LVFVVSLDFDCEREREARQFRPLARESERELSNLLAEELSNLLREREREKEQRERERWRACRIP
jgi:hypothetical protein